MFYYYTEDIHFNLNNRGVVEYLISFIIAYYNKSEGEISFIFTSDKYLYDLNITSLNHRYFTDVITFDYCIGEVVSGDIFISIDRVLENSIFYDIPFQYEFLRIIVHGILHLLGFNDVTSLEKLVMTKLENQFLDLEI